MSQKYQNEKSPILNGQKKPKTSGKVQKIRDLEGHTAFRPFENTRYISSLPRSGEHNPADDLVPEDAPGLPRGSGRGLGHEAERGAPRGQ